MLPEDKLLLSIDIVVERTQVMAKERNDAE